MPAQALQNTDRIRQMLCFHEQRLGCMRVQCSVCYLYLFQSKIACCCGGLSRHQLGLTRPSMMFHLLTCPRRPLFDGVNYGLWIEWASRLYYSGCSYTPKLLTKLCGCKVILVCEMSLSTSVARVFCSMIVVDSGLSKHERW